jgi:histone H3/H4
METYWKKCSSCKSELGFGSLYHVCSVSTCQHKRKGYQFCSVSCWDAHLGYANHKQASCLERTSPLQSEYERTLQKDRSNTSSTHTKQVREPVRRIISERNSPSPQTRAHKISTDTLVVVSKIKALIREQSGFNTSQCCIEALTNKVVEECLKGIESATEAERKTVMGRDIK